MGPHVGYGGESLGVVLARGQRLSSLDNLYTRRDRRKNQDRVKEYKNGKEDSIESIS